jgi:hypothetical protein
LEELLIGLLVLREEGFVDGLGSVKVREGGRGREGQGQGGTREVKQGRRRGRREELLVGLLVLREEGFVH